MIPEGKAGIFHDCKLLISNWLNGFSGFTAYLGLKKEEGE
jgi:hypothetical protein